MSDLLLPPKNIKAVDTKNAIVGDKAVVFPRRENEEGAVDNLVEVQSLLQRLQNDDPLIGEICDKPMLVH